MNKFDQFVKHKLKLKYYIRYADDFVIFSEDKAYLEGLISKMKSFLKARISLTLHPDKIYIKTLHSGVDFLGWVNFFDHRVLRKTTKQRLFKRMEGNPKIESLSSYLGLLKHWNGHKIKEKLMDNFYQNS